MSQSLWSAIARKKPYPRLERDGIHVDVAIVGAGITGVTAAILLKESGQRVAVLEARGVASGVTGGTTAHLTQALDTRYHELESKFGREGARLAAASSRAAIEQIALLGVRHGVSNDFEYLPGYLYTEREEQVDELDRELNAALRAGVPVNRSSVPLPIPVKAGVCFENQAQFHPLRYVLALAERIPGNGSFLFEESRVLAVDEGEPCRLHLEQGVTLSAARVIVATHAPINKLLLQTKLAHYRSYVVSGRVEQAAHGLFWDTEDPYHYLRAQRVEGGIELIVGGEDHKTGQEEDPEERWERLSVHASRFGLREVKMRWSAQVIEPVDGLPFIGKNAASERVYVATGFSGNGMTFGTLAGMLLSDACLGRQSPYADLYSATRIKPIAGLGSFLQENIDFPMHLLSDVVRPPNARSIAEIEPGEAKIVRISGERLGVYRDQEGRLHAVSPVCTHLGCHVSFNGAEKTWDCPCHGSRFDVDGKVLDGPAVKALRQRQVTE